MDYCDIETGDTPCPRSGAVAAVRWSSCEEIPHTQGQRNPRKMVGPGGAMKRYPMPKGNAEVPARW